MCMYCKRTGQWNDMEHFIRNNKVKEKSDIHKSIERERLRESLRNIKKSTQELQIISQDELTVLLNEFKLPVSPENTSFQHI